MVCRVLAALPDDLDPLPAALRRQWGLLELRQALRSLHAPKSGEEAEEARRRLVFDEFFYHQVNGAFPALASLLVTNPAKDSWKSLDDLIGRPVRNCRYGYSTFDAPSFLVIGGGNCLFCPLENQQQAD